MATLPGKNENPGGISSDAVKKATGKSWEQWIKLLDREKAFELPHKSIAILVCDKFGQTGWWSQMVTVGYEQAKGLRVKHQKGKTFEVGISKTIPVPVSKLYSTWQDEKIRNKWLKEKYLVTRTATKNKSMRITWKDGKQILSLNFYSKGESKSQVTVQHNKLESRQEATAVKKYWKEKLDALSNFLNKE